MKIRALVPLFLLLNGIALSHSIAGDSSKGVSKLIPFKDVFIPEGTVDASSIEGPIFGRIAVDSSGNLWFIEWRKGRYGGDTKIKVLTPQGNLLREIEKKKFFPMDIFGSRDEKLYILLGRQASDGHFKVYVYNTQGQRLKEINDIWGDRILVDSRGNLYIGCWRMPNQEELNKKALADILSGKKSRAEDSKDWQDMEVKRGGTYIHKYSPKGKFLKSFHSMPKGQRKFLFFHIGATGFNIDDDDYLYVRNANDYVIYKYSPVGKLLQKFTTKPPQFKGPPPGIIDDDHYYREHELTQENFWNKWTNPFPLYCYEKYVISAFNLPSKDSTITIYNFYDRLTGALLFRVGSLNYGLAGIDRRRGKFYFTSSEKFVAPKKIGRYSFNPPVGIMGKSD